ncbi:hypothetical protein [Streptomyces sp. NPDC004658]|uniref:hypothetical protein n=1 Tax=Streptomyces sp. NPDC004658 TaxID=3154672 RepID=UPI0033B755F0
MGESAFTEALLEQVRQARADPAEALQGEGGAFAVAVAQDKLDDAVRVAQQHGVAVTAIEAEGE